MSIASEEYPLLVKSIYCLWNVIYCLFSVSVKFLFTLLAEIALVSDIVECVGDCRMCLFIACEEYLFLFSVLVKLLFTLLAGIVLLSEIVGCVGDCGMLSVACVEWMLLVECCLLLV